MKLEQVQRMKKTHFYANFPLRAASILTKVAVRAFFLVGLFTACRSPLSEISHPPISALRQLNGTQFDCFERKNWYASPCCSLGFITGSIIFRFLRRFEQIDALLKALKQEWPLWTEAVGKLGVLQWNRTAAFSSHFESIAVRINQLPPKIRAWRKNDAAFTPFINCNIIMTHINVAINS